jgi:hypothetical protein
MAADVDRWLAERVEPAAPLLRRVREIIVAADPRLREFVQNRTLTFAYKGDFAAFVQVAKPGVTLMLLRGARIPGKFPRLEGNGPTARFLRFADLAEVEARAEEIALIARAWCELMASGEKTKGMPPRKGAAKAGRASPADRARKTRR